MPPPAFVEKNPALYNQHLVTYLITFTCYGARLHGQETGSVDRAHNVPGSPLLSANRARASFEHAEMAQAAYELDTLRRTLVIDSLIEVCAYRNWTMLAAHVRANHVHVVVDASDPPEKVMTAFKAYASRRLNRAGLDHPERRRWSRHGSTRYLWTRDQLDQAISYVLHGQGEPMATYPKPDQ